jgi:predicted GIY-YIG superfamily endonuclease
MDIKRRIKEHFNDRGSKFLKGNKPKSFKVITSAFSRSDAMAVEKKIKKLPHEKKEAIFYE